MLARPQSYFIQKVAELVPRRPALPRVSVGAQKAVAEYEGQVASVARFLLDEYRKTLGQSDSANADDVRRRLLYDLNSTGKYYAFKEQLKRSIIKVVREKFLKTSSISDPTERQQFLSNLYVFLADHMHER